MTTENKQPIWKDRIVKNPQILAGKPTVKGTRISVELITDLLKGGHTEAEIIEDYPDDKYSPSCLLLGFTQIGRPLHIVVSLEDRDLVKVITVYEPDPDKWIDHTRRRR